MKKTFSLLLLLIFCYLLLLFLTEKEIFSYRFNHKLIERYFLSQDITHEVPGKRLFLSDGEIYLAAGYLYAKGNDPTLYNFEHPPLIKYLFGFSILIFNSPYPVQIMLGVGLLVLLYLLGLRVYRSDLVSLLACLFLLTDPLFLDISSQPLLDLGQTVFALLYTIFVFYFPNNYVFQGTSLALFAGTKFWASPLFFITTFTVYNLYKKKFRLKNFILHLIIAFFVYSLFYLKTFMINKGNFNIIFLILKVFKYRIQHNVSSFFGSSLILFFTGYFKSWWGTKEFIRGNI